VKAAVLLADKGTQAQDKGTLNLLNVGWATTMRIGPLTPPHAVAIFFEAELAECNRSIPIELELQDAEAHVVELPGPAGPQLMRVSQSLTIVPPLGAPTGTPGRANLLMEIAPGLPLEPGNYRWLLRIDGDERDDWSAGFYVAAPPSTPVFGAGPAT
jgi:hypothetical protein